MGTGAQRQPWVGRRSEGAGVQEVQRHRGASLPDEVGEYPELQVWAQVWGGRRWGMEGGRLWERCKEGDSLTCLLAFL